MKKFTLLMASAAVAATAMAGQPVLVKNGDRASVQEVTADAKAVVAKTDVDKSTIVKDSYMETFKPVELTEAGDVRFRRPGNALYNGLRFEGEGLGYFNYMYGVVGVHGGLTFTNFTDDPTNSEWTWNDMLKEPNNFTRKSVDLSFGEPEYPESFIADVTLNCDGLEYDEPVTPGYRFGGNLNNFLFDQESNQYIGEYYGLTRYGYEFGGTTTQYMSYDATDATNYEASGIAKGWADVLAYFEGGYDDNSEGHITNAKIESIITSLPTPSSPYWMSKIWMWVQGEASDAAELQCNIYEVDENGNRNPNPVAKATSVVEKGKIYFVDFDIIAIDEEGFEVYEPFVSSKALIVEITGINKENNITKFTPVLGANTIMPIGASRNDYFSISAGVKISFEYDGQEIVDTYTCPYNYYADDTRSSLYVPAHYYIMFDIAFPYVTRADGTFGDFNVLLPEATAASGSVGVFPYYYELANMIDAGIMTAETEDDWFEFTVEPFDPETGVTAIKVDAEALPAGVESRTGSIVFSGMAQDFTVNVYQGAIASGLGSIVAPVKNGVEYFDVQGRKLQSAPATGLYIERAGDKVNKVIR